MGKILSTLFLQFYCLPISHVIYLLFIFTVIFQSLKKACSYSPLWKPIVYVMVILEITVIIFATVINREAGDSFDHRLIPLHSYRAVMNGDNIEILRSNFMNVVLFYPAGLLLCSLLPEKWCRWYKILLVFAVLCVLSAGIEYTQYIFSLGRVEIDDVIHNSLGALLGSIFCLIPLEPWRCFQIIPPTE